MELAEKSLANDPTSPQANQLLFEAASKAGFPEVASFALETLVGANPKDTKILHQLAAHYSGIGENDKAVAVYNRIIQLNPSDLDANKKSKDASRRIGWPAATDFYGSSAGPVEDTQYRWTSLSTSKYKPMLRSHLAEGAASVNIQEMRVQVPLRPSAYPCVSVSFVVEPTVLTF